MSSKAPVLVSDSSDDDDASKGAGGGLDANSDGEEDTKVDKTTAIAVMLQLLRKKQERAGT